MDDAITPDVQSIPEYMLTTTDNPYDPFDHFNEWLEWDTSAGYHTATLLARVTRQSDDMSESDQHQAIQDAIDEIVKENVFGVLMKVKRSTISLVESFETATTTEEAVQNAS